MSKLNQTLFIARSSESADVYLRTHQGAIKTLTLSSLLGLDAFVKSVAIDPMIGKIVLQRAVQSLSLKHFDYLADAEESLGELYAHILACKRNKVGFEHFGYDEKKLFELLQIQTAYEDLKASLDLRDSADVLLEALGALAQSSYFDQFTAVVIDTFEEEGIRFYTNRCEEEALAFIRTLPHAVSLPFQDTKLNPIATFTPVPSRFDEALFAIKAVRKLMLDKVADTSIAIVVGDLAKYRRVLEAYAPQYGVCFRFSSGVALLQSPLLQQYLKAKTFESFKESFAKQLQDDVQSGVIKEDSLASITNEFMQIQKIHLRAIRHLQETQKLFGIKGKIKEVVLNIAKESHIPPLKDKEMGVWVSEPNQITLRKFDHIIFIGTDISQFPPKTKGNFLSNILQRELHLGFNNSYKLSEYYFKKLKQNTTNLHIATAQQEGKKKLFISPILSQLPQTRFEEQKYDAPRELLLSGKRIIQEDDFEAYVTSLEASQVSSYDGALKEHRIESGVLSASSLNEYAKCPLRYLLTYHYKVDPLAIDRDDDAFEASDIGTIFHSIAEVFAQDVKAKKILLEDEATLKVKKHLEAIAVQVHQDYIQKEIVGQGKSVNIFHEIVLQDLLKGLYEEHHERGLLIRFLDYVYESGRLEEFEKSEERFMLDSKFTITANKEAAIIKGFIDRIDCNVEEKRVRVIDYKTGKYSKNKENRLVEEMVSFKQFQLPLYLLYATQAYKDYTIDAFLLSMRSKNGTKEYARISTDSQSNLVFDTLYAQKLKETILQMQEHMKQGEFGMRPSEQNCEYCPYERICYKDIMQQKWQASTTEEGSYDE